MQAQLALSILGAGGLLRDALKLAGSVALGALLAVAFTIAGLAGLVGSTAVVPMGTSRENAARLFPGLALGSGVPAVIAGPASLRPELARLPALNQYDARNYTSAQSWARWRGVSCSAAALVWLLSAYGVPLRSIDEAIALIGEGSGISPSLGLLDASGRPLARAIRRVGLAPRNANVGRSPAALMTWLDEGPLALDGAAWFGSGHWFIAYGYDSGGVFTRDSSGHDTRYLTWAQLYGAPAGFSGNVVGITGRGTP